MPYMYHLTQYSSIDSEIHGRSNTCSAMCIFFHDTHFIYDPTQFTLVCLLATEYYIVYIITRIMM